MVWFRTEHYFITVYYSHGKEVTYMDTSVTQKGQVTIPANVRQALGLKPRDKVRFELDPEHGVAILRRAPSSILELYGSVTPKKRPEDFPSLRDEFEHSVANEVMSESE
jgi:AbrB family looped-hinge helix DNA binding protein